MFEITPNPNALKLSLEHAFEVGMDYFEIKASNPEMINKILYLIINNCQMFKQYKH